MSSSSSTQIVINSATAFWKGQNVFYKKQRRPAPNRRSLFFIFKVKHLSVLIHRHISVPSPRPIPSSDRANQRRYVLPRDAKNANNEPRHRSQRVQSTRTLPVTIRIVTWQPDRAKKKRKRVKPPENRKKGDRTLLPFRSDGNTSTQSQR